MHVTTASRSLVRDLRHPSVRDLPELLNRQARDDRGLYLVDGLRFLFQAFEQHAPIERLIFCRDLAPRYAGSAIARQRRVGVPVVEVTTEVYRRLSLAHEPQGVLALMRKQWTPLWHARPAPGSVRIAVSTIQSPGNLGTMIRTCDAVGADGVICLDGEVDPWDPGTVRATMGANFSQRYIRATASELIAWKQRHGVRIFGTSPAGEVDYRAVSYAGPTVLFLGGERQGLSEAEAAVCDQLVRIPMVGRSDSLNVAVAAGVLLYEVFNQRRGALTDGEPDPTG